MYGETDASADLNRLIADLRGFAGKKEVQRQLRIKLRKPLPEARQKIRAAAVRLLPSRNGLGRWVARTRVTASVRLGAGGTAGVTLRGGRDSDRYRSDIRAIDRGRVRAPLFGDRRHWHNQSVPVGFFTGTVRDDMAGAWRRATIEAVNEATEVLRRG